MKVIEYVCDLCAHEGIRRLATKRYWAEGGEERWIHACPTHDKQVKGYGFKTEDVPGINWDNYSE